jgi:ADP-ribosylglycohydrolase
LINESIYESRVVASALWAAAGDALGWISELTDERGLKRRMRGKKLARPVEWRRKIGGMSGPEIVLPAGTYSDDTQLRLAICRSIRGDGVFDVEAFAKVELTIWPSFALGAGRGTKAAASNLQRRDVTWFSNFFSSPKGPIYTEAGGNGAAMRIQPHVWQRRSGESAYLIDVVRDSIVTHGNMRGICGAVFHANCVDYALKHGRAPSPDHWRKFVADFGRVEDAILSDDQLKRFWLKAWESASGLKIGEALDSTCREMLSDIDRVCAIQVDGLSSYRHVVDVLEGFGAKQGTGTNTALAAAYISWLAKPDAIEDALIEVASAIGSDTDTIGTMVGAILGGTTDRLPSWEIQDRDYIAYEASRVALASNRYVQESFGYPDLLKWTPPSAQSDVLGAVENGVAVAGLGDAKMISRAGTAGTYVWFWIGLHFGQTILCKAKESGMQDLQISQLFKGNSPLEAQQFQQELLEIPAIEAHPSRLEEPVPLGRLSVDDLSDIAISSGFDKGVMGDCLYRCFQSENGLELAIAFSAITAKAYMARKRASNRKKSQ